MVHAQVIRERGHRGVRRHPGAAIPVAAPAGGALGGAGGAAGRSTRPGPPTGPRSSTSRNRARTTTVSTSTLSPARCSSGRPSGRATGVCGSTARATQGRAPAADRVPDRRRGQRQRGHRTGPGAARPACRTWPGWRTARRPSAGRRAEDIEDAKLRGPLVLRSRGRAVTAEDFVELTKQVAPEIARVHCVGAEGARVRVLVVPVRRGRRRRPDPPGGPDPAGRIARTGSAPTWTSGGWSAPGW